MVKRDDDEDPRRAHRDFTPQEKASHEYSNPVERFWQIPTHSREWLEQLREEDIHDLKEAIRLKRKFEAAGWFIKWIIIIPFVSFLVGTAALGKSIQEILSWLPYGKH